MEKLSEEHAAKWAKMRSRGFLRFVLVIGIGRAGVAYWIVFAALDYLTGSSDSTDSSLLATLQLWLPGGLIIGATFGFFLWLIMEKRYRAFLDVESGERADD